MTTSDFDAATLSLWDSLKTRTKFGGGLVVTARPATVEPAPEGTKAIVALRIHRTPMDPNSGFVHPSTRAVARPFKAANLLSVTGATAGSKKSTETAVSLAGFEGRSPPSPDPGAEPSWSCRVCCAHAGPRHFPFPMSRQGHQVHGGGGRGAAGQGAGVPRPPAGRVRVKSRPRQRPLKHNVAVVAPAVYPALAHTLASQFEYGVVLAAAVNDKPGSAITAFQLMGVTGLSITVCNAALSWAVDHKLATVIHACPELSAGTIYALTSAVYLCADHVSEGRDQPHAYDVQTVRACEKFIRTAPGSVWLDPAMESEVRRRRLRALT